MYLLPSQVVLSSLASVTPVARAILEPPRGERPVCNEECFREWREEVGLRQKKVKGKEEVQEQEKLIGFINGAVCQLDFQKQLLDFTPVVGQPLWIQ